jgi:hypothetical protein
LRKYSFIYGIYNENCIKKLLVAFLDAVALWGTLLRQYTVSCKTSFTNLHSFVDFGPHCQSASSKNGYSKMDSQITVRVQRSAKPASPI